MSDASRSIGQLAQLACTWEVLARKAGNVCPGREFPDLTVNDFLLSAAAIAPVLEEAPRQSLGVTILRCIEATRRVVNTNTNLGIVLLLAPLASVPLEQPLRPRLSEILARTTVEDSRDVFQAIRLANPGGLGEVEDQDVRAEPTLPLREVMALAKRDLIARQYTTDFGDLFHIGFAKAFANFAAKTGNVEHAVVNLQLCVLSQRYDSLIERKLGITEAGKVTLGALRLSYPDSDTPEAYFNFDLDTPQARQAYLNFDAWLRSENHVRNPGTTADLIAAALFVALREQLISPAMPFTWDEHPFGFSEPEA